NDSSPGQLSKFLGSSPTLQESSPKKCRKIVGRGASYYEKYGINCVFIPKNMSVIYPPNRKLDPMLSIRDGPMNKTNQRKKQWKNAKMECSFCKNIPNSDEYKTHWLKNSQNVIT